MLQLTKKVYLTIISNSITIVGLQNCAHNYCKDRFKELVKYIHEYHVISAGDEWDCFKAYGHYNLMVST